MARYHTPSILPSEAAPSSDGDTFSALAESTLQSHHRHASTSITPLEFHTFIGYDGSSQSRPPSLEIEGYDDVPSARESRAPPPPLFPWRYEFSWAAEGVVTFAGDPLRDIQTPNLRHPSELGDATVGESTERFATVPTDASTRKSADERTPRPETLEDLDRVVEEQNEIQEQILERRAYLFDRLEAYWRSHPPERSAGRQRGKGTARQAGGHLSARESVQPYTRRGLSGSRRKIGQGSTDEDGDDDDEDDSTPTSTSLTSSTRRRWYACPYQKWKPQHYLMLCGAGFRRIIDVKYHLLRQHSRITCSHCHTSYDTEQRLQLHNLQGCVRRPRSHPQNCIMSAMQREAIKTHLGRTNLKTPQQQWEFLFRTVFPNEPFPTSIYLLPREEESRNDLERWVLSAGTKALDDIHRTVLCDMPDLNHHEPKDCQLATVMMQFIAHRMKSHMLEDVSEERLHTDFATAQHNSAIESSSSSAVSAPVISAYVTNHQAMTSLGPVLDDSATVQLPSETWNLDPLGCETSLKVSWPMSTAGDSCVDTGIAPGWADTTSNLATLDLTGGIPGITQLPDTSSFQAEQWMGGGSRHELEQHHHFSTYLTNEAGPSQPNTISSTGLGNSYICSRPLTSWNPLVQGENWRLTGDQGFGPSHMVDEAVIRGWKSPSGLQPISEMPEY